MISTFEPDVFSNSVPIWTLVEPSTGKNIINLLDAAGLISKKNIKSIESSGAFEINSSNIKITTFEGSQILIKRWSRSSETKEIQNTLDLMQWLTDKNLPLLPAIKLSNKHTIIYFNNYNWSFFPFGSGNYFSGIGKELEITALATGKLIKILKDLPLEIYPSKGPSHLTDMDNAILIEMDENRKKWQNIFGNDYAKLLKSEWNELKEYWDLLRANDFHSGPIQPMHFDLHPHNLLVENNQISAILDFESCKLMPIGFGLAFNALKQCRQSATLSNAHPSEIGKRYLNILCNEFPEFSTLIDNFEKLASSEVLRRLCIIFRLNLKEGKNTWNHVLPIQLGHLKEAKILFGS